MEFQDNSTKKRLDYFFEFVNFDINTLDYDNLVVVSIAYVRFAFHNDGLNSKVKYDLLTRSVFDKTEDNLGVAKDFLKRLQNHFRGILNKVIDPSSSPLSLKQKGTRLIEIVDGKFVESFQTKNLEVEGLNIELEKKVVEAIFTDIIINANLLPADV